MHTYDAENWMLSAVISAHPVGTYTYSGVNLRTTRNVNGTLTTYIYNGNNVIAEYLNNASPQSPGREYIYAGNRLIGTTSGTDLKYYHQDHQSIRLITDVNAAKVDDRGHFPYGELWYDNGSFSTKFVFTNYKRDPDESNNDYAINRFYSNRLGRFMQADKLSGTYTNPQTFNLFAYTTNDPVNLIDPDGNERCADGSDADVCVFATQDPVPVIDFVPIGGFIPFDPGDLGGTYINRRPIRGPRRPQPPSNRTPNVITCSTVLPDGSTVGSRVQALASQINSSMLTLSTPYGSAMRYNGRPSPLSVPSFVYSGTNFRKMFGTARANYAFLGDAGNFAYAAVSANVGVPLVITELVAGAYTLVAHPFSDLGPYGMDPSARVQIPAGYSSSCAGH